jgi:hypothetical protein
MRYALSIRNPHSEIRSRIIPSPTFAPSHLPTFAPSHLPFSPFYVLWHLTSVLIPQSSVFRHLSSNSFFISIWHKLKRNKPKNAKDKIINLLELQSINFLQL